jgi:hypothetical protein
VTGPEETDRRTQLFADGAADYGSTTLLVLWLIVVHDLWERPSSRAAREQAVLFNAATTTTIVLGVASLYLGLFLLILLSSEVLIHPDVLENVVGTRVDFQQYLRLAAGKLAGHDYRRPWLRSRQ